MGDLKVVDWLGEAEAKGKTKSIGGLGGWFNFNEEGLRWADYIKESEESKLPHYEALRTEILGKKIRHGGDWHQDVGTPLFSDGTVGSFSFRGWGDLLAAIWSEAEGKDYDYMDFYMCGFIDLECGCENWVAG